MHRVTLTKYADIRLYLLFVITTLVLINLSGLVLQISATL